MNYTFKHILQSPWLGEMYNKYLSDTGYFVEIGMGHTTTPKSRQSEFEIIELHTSNTIELLNLNWEGIYIEPVAEFCYEAFLLLNDKLDKVKFINIGASNKYELCKLYGKETLIKNDITEYRDYATNKKYDYPERTVLCKPTSVILSEVGCPINIDLMSIDVEGYEERVIEGIDFNLHNPRMLIIESTFVKLDSINSLIPDYYEMIKGDELNSCFINKEKV